MDPRDRDRIIHRYNARLAQFGDDPRTLASGPAERHAMRFEVLRDVGIESGASVLDVGCGFGDFFGWLQQQGINVRYTGVDINADLLAVAKAKYPGGEFLSRDLQTQPLDQRFDYVVSSSAFNLRLDSIDNYAFVADMLA